MSAVGELVDVERDRLADLLAGLDERGWRAASLCAGWSVRDTVVHVLMAYELRLTRFLPLLVRHRFSFDALAREWALADRRPPARVLADLRATRGMKFLVPGAPPEAELSHLVCHALDVSRPLAAAYDVAPEALLVTLDALTAKRARGSLDPAVRHGVRLEATDVDWGWGDGPVARGPGAAVVSVLVGRRAAWDDLEGD